MAHENPLRFGQVPEIPMKMPWKFYVDFNGFLITLKNPWIKHHVFHMAIHGLLMGHHWIHGHEKPMVIPLILKY